MTLLTEVNDMRGYFTNTVRLVRFILRRERIVSAVWLACLILFSYTLASGMGEMFDAPARQALAETMKNPAMIAMMGPVYGAGNYTVGAMYSQTMFLWVAMTVAAMNIFLVVRHTRADEERGRAEVVRSLPTGRLATLNAAMITALIVNIILAVFTGLGIASVGEESMGFGPAMLYGAALGIFGLFFAAAAALFSQLSASSRGAIGYSFIALGALYMLRAAGDVGSEALALISPLGLIQRPQFFVENNVLPVLIVFIEAVAVAAAAYILNAVRDIDQGFISARPGRAGGSKLLRTSSGLALRLMRNSMIAWVVVLFCLGASYGTILPDIDMFIEESEFYQLVVGANDEYTHMEMFSTTINIIAAVFAIVPIMTIALRPRTEEREGRAEQILAKPVSREKYLAGYVIPAFLLSVLLQLASVFGLYMASVAFLDEPLSLIFLLEANMVYLPALWAMIGLAVFLTGLLPRATSFIWAYFGFSFFAVFMGRMMDLPSFLPKLSPFGFIPQLPVDEVNFTTLLILTVVALSLTLIGTIFYERRDMVTA